jgi:biotin-independent malonate decarboxylase gamma subunit
MLALTGAVLEFIERNPVPASLFLIEDSLGHELSRRAEVTCLSAYFAQHAGALAVAKARGHRVLGLLLGTGHSAAFFANALQADTVYAMGTARVIAMDSAAIARVTGLAEVELAMLIEDDPMLGQPVRHLAALGGIAEIWDRVGVESLIDAARRAPGR